MDRNGASGGACPALIFAANIVACPATYGKRNKKKLVIGALPPNNATNGTPFKATFADSE